MGAGCAAPGQSNPDGDASDDASHQPDGSKPLGDAGNQGGDGSDASSGKPEAGDGGGGASETGAAEGGGSSCASLPLCEDFDEDTPGAAPPGPTWSLVLGCDATMMTDGTAADGGLIVEVDSSQHHSGKNSLRVVGGDSCGYYVVNTSAFSSIGTDLYARFWVRFSGPPTTGHNGYVSMYSGPALSSAVADYNNTPQLRLGFQGGAIVWNYLSSDATLPDIDTMGEMQSVATPVTQWSCIEFHLDQTNANIEFRFQGSSPEASVSGLSYDGTATAGVSDTWMSSGPTSLALKSFGLGWLGLNNQYTVWFDDVALSGTTWIGCE